jgi:aryl-alcohol dehydrogenase-like predicted oxidoreductase
VKTRKLGRINFEPTIITLGGCGPGYVSQSEADVAVKMALDEYGLNMFDVAPSYGDAEVRLNPWIRKYREQMFLAEKTIERTREGAMNELQRSLKQTGANYFDLYQFHAVGSTGELDQILGNGGAMEALKEAQDVGLIKHIGITGHADIQVFVDAVNRFDFDTVLLPVNVASMVDPQPVNDFRPLLEIAEERDIGIIAIKSILKQRWKTEDKTYNTWYEPLDTPEAIEKAVWFTLSQPGVTTYSLPCDIRLWKPILEAAKQYRRLSLKEQEEVIGFAREMQFSPLFPEPQH